MSVPRATRLRVGPARWQGPGRRAPLPHGTVPGRTSGASAGTAPGPPSSATGVLGGSTGSSGGAALDGAVALSRDVIPRTGQSVARRAVRRQAGHRGRNSGHGAPPAAPGRSAGHSPSPRSGIQGTACSGQDVGAFPETMGGRGPEAVIDDPRGLSALFASGPATPRRGRYLRMPAHDRRHRSARPYMEGERHDRTTSAARGEPWRARRRRRPGMCGRRCLEHPSFRLGPVVRIGPVVIGSVLTAGFFARRAVAL